MWKYLAIYEGAVSRIWLCNRSLLISLYMGRFLCYFLSVYCPYYHHSSHALILMYLGFTLMAHSWLAPDCGRCCTHSSVAGARHTFSSTTSRKVRLMKKRPHGMQEGPIVLLCCYGFIWHYIKRSSVAYFHTALMLSYFHKIPGINILQ
jgi:hypothetical protein